MTSATAIVIRTARVGDAPAIFEAHQASVTHLCAESYTELQIATWFEGRSHEIHYPAIQAGQLLLAERSGRVMGFCGFVPGEVTLLFVHPKAAGAGLGSRLLSMAIERATVGHHGPVAVVATLNSRRFYEKHGFAAVEPSCFVRGAAEVRFAVIRMLRERGLD